MFIEYIHSVLFFLLTLLPVANPIASTTLLLTLGNKIKAKERKKQIYFATLYVGIIILVCFYAGKNILNAFGVSINALRLAGGIILLYFGFDLLFNVTEKKQITEKNHLQQSHLNISFVPLALPGTAGPGTIALIISSSSSLPSSCLIHFVIWSVTALFTLMFLICLLSANKIFKRIGPSGIDAISRIMGFILISMGVQFIITGFQNMLIVLFHL
ncbi:MarC family NAAT transporter [Candidatus Portiera aleyrodidarum]|uniref:MarC family NAAT transporter n=1 Tax=Candidatus Portiera aleyrodidarum TaxID=91844 RepID=UPI00027E67FB|nr:MarC family NAAT transporter [Candidatus Portiera aleyrodidarum]AFS18975.1 UPF0056 inner membrane protein marC [Candidatus Portiera aleyrodidarum BT-QVLC]